MPGGNRLAETMFSMVRTEMPSRAESNFLLSNDAVMGVTGVMLADVMISLK